MMFWYGNDGGVGNGWGYLLMGVGMLVFWGLVIAGLVVVFRQPERRDRVAGGMVASHRTAQQLLAERFARGDIDETEFTGRLAALHGQKHL
ncbi:hypothetical protein RHODO2019_06370 [Rhodococcus antarcticus]|uniref:SHOCT domain-containing protein n=1 Tax=Rhodococcus antarcticus TaxID=2987751 RepID=A0ABY6P4F4_9NOCA|nr:hypothetical protein [Rhodococcus antarcticus]UZJ26053.1 hypothetical protein RHODO2019_06370 [Rhodococcus antarcticus]